MRVRRELFAGFLALLCLAGAPRGDADPGVADRATYLKAFTEAASVQWPKNRMLKIVCHGHSVPAGYFKTPDVRTFDAYPHLLHVALKERFPYAVINVVVTAIGGEASVTGAERFERDVLSLRPDVVLIDYALNDCGLPLPDSRRAWTEMIEKATAQGVKVILLTPTADKATNWSDPADPIVQNAEQIRALAAEHHVALVDSQKAFQDAVAAGTNLDDLMSQRNHPNRKGHELVAGQLIEWFPKPTAE